MRKKNRMTGWGCMLLAAALMLALLTACSLAEVFPPGGGSAPGGPSVEEQSAGAEQDAASEASEENTASNGDDVPDIDTGPVLRVGSVTEIDSLDPCLSQNAGTRDLLFNLYEGLVKPDESGNLQPAVAREFQISEDALTYSFTLRSGVRFHDGSPVTAEDVEYSLRRVMEDSDGVLAPNAFSQIAEIQIPDEAHVDIILRNPNTEFLPQIAAAAILPAANPDPASRPVGTGPYRVVSQNETGVTLKRFDGYWGLPAYVRTVEWLIFPDLDAVMDALDSGGIDLAFQLPLDIAEQLSAEFTIYAGSMNLVQALYLNNTFPPFADVRVRQALCYATDKEDLLQEVFGGYGTPIGSSMYPGFEKYYLPELNDLYSTDLARAKALLHEAGYTDGFSFTIRVPSNYIQHVDTARNLTRQYRQIGVKVEVEEVDWDTWVREVYQGRQFDATVVGVDASTLSAAALLGLYVTGTANNFTGYHSDAYDDAYQKAVATLNDTEKTDYIWACEWILAEDAASVFLQDPTSFTAMRQTFTGYVFYPLHAQNLARIRPVE